LAPDPGYLKKMIWAASLSSILAWPT
jgi:hypothetical protein